MRGLKKGYGHLWLPRWLSGKEITCQGSSHRRLRFYLKKGLLISVEGQEEVADTTALVLKALQPYEA